MKSNRNSGKQFVGKRVKLSDGRTGVATAGGYDLVSVDLDKSHWWCGPVKEIKSHE